MGESRFVVVVAALAAVALLAGCTGGGAPRPQPSVSSSSEPSAEATAEPAAWPLSLVATTCDELLPTAIRESVFGVELPPASGYSNGEGARSVYASAFENAGGLSCAWKAPAGTGNAEDDRVVAIRLLPRSAAAAAQIADAMGATQVSDEASTGCDWRACTLNVAIGEYWVGALVGGLAEPHNEPGVPAEVADVFDTVLATVTSTPASAEPTWPSDRENWPTSCEQLIPETELGVALGMPGAAFTSGYSYEGSNIGGAAFLTAGGLVCGLATSSGSRMGSIMTLPGSSIAFAAARAQAIQSDDVEPRYIAGLGPDAGYLTWRQDMPGSATLSVDIHGTWVELGIAAAVHGETDRPADERLLQLAEYLATR